ncbi:MAG: RES family NAD+ phosphorylase [Burkholderiales bacterium]|nr:RES family NAD+ phosphorylase [Burkholderiales bacterium]
MAASEPSADARWRAQVWRAVESQHLIATMRLVGDDLTAQAVLEDILESAKPPVPEDARHLHWLLATPFRYPAPPGGSRFRAVGDPGVFYAGLVRRVACAEAGYWKWRFVADSAGLARLDAHPMSVFPAAAAGRAWDLTRGQLARRRRDWTRSADYAPTQALARRARAAGVQVLVYESVRDPESGACAAVLDARALANRDPLPAAETWYLTVNARGAVWQRAGVQAFSFDFA